MPRRSRRATLAAAALTALGWLAGPAAAQLAPAAAAGPVAPSAPAAPAAEGLLVRLKQAPAHAVLARDAQRARDEATRWRGVLDGAALQGRAGARPPKQRAVGRDQQLLDFGRPLDAAEAEELAARLRRRPEVEWVAPNRREPPLQLAVNPPSDPLYAQQWWLLPPGGSNNNALAERRRGLPGFLDAWTSGLAGAAGERAPVVAVLDTGITPHPDLQGRVLPGHDFVSADLFSADGQGGRDADPSDPGDGVDAADLADPRFAGCSIGASSWHGTNVAGLLAAIADNAYGGAGILRAGRVLPVRVAGKCGATVADIVDGMRWAAGLSVAGVPDNPNPARIVNISFGGSLDCGREYQDTIDELHDAGVLVVAAAGNDHGKVSRPASCRGVVGVVALNRDGFKTHYSNFGSVLADTGIATVGGDDNEGAWGPLLADGGIVALTNSGVAGPVSPDHAAHAGTSFAAPMAAGTLALMLSVNPALGAEQLLAGLRASARPHPGSTLIGPCSDVNPGRCVCTRQTCGVGVLDARQAITYAAAPDSYVGPGWPVEDIGGTEVARAVALGADRPPAGASDGGGGGSGAGESAGGGGGALGLPWLLGLALVLPTLRRARQRRSR